MHGSGRGRDAEAVAVVLMAVLALSGTGASAALGAGGGGPVGARGGAIVGAGTGRLLTGTVPRLLSAATRLGPLSPGQRVRVILPLRLPRQAQLDSFVADQYTLGSPAYHRFLTPARFGERFGAPAEEVRRALLVLRRLGLSPSSPAVNRL